jgi:hypothetical protein
LCTAMYVSRGCITVQQMYMEGHHMHADSMSHDYCLDHSTPQHSYV